MRKSMPMALVACTFSLALLANAGAQAPKQAATGRVAPIFPYSPPGLVYVEGEDAVSTNMASEATLNYGCSGGRALQLARSGRLPEGTVFYAEFCVFVDEAGSYELWYCGTPPGSKDEFAISFASPLSVSVDGGEPIAVNRESVNVVETLAPAYYWIRTKALQLSAGAHVLRFEVSSKRKLDDRFFFYLDAFFLASPQALAAASSPSREGYPAAFPKDPAQRSIDNPFRSFEDYLAQIQASPSTLAPYVELAGEYSLAGDYLNAIKTLSKAAVVAPRDPAVRLLAAKNRIWRGDVKEGIEAYGLYISIKPDDLGAYEEAGKVAAWSGRFSDSEYFYKTGLAVFPGDLSLTVNLGLSLLWSGRVNDAERDFAQAQKSALAEPGSAARLAEIYRLNGLGDRAVAAYENAIAAYPDRLGFYLDEAAVLASQGKDSAALAIDRRIAAAFEGSPELDKVLAAAKARRDLKSDRIAELEARIAQNPEDLGLRDELTRVYAWNGRRADAARQLESILAARFAKSLSDSDISSASVVASQLSAAVLQADAEARLVAQAALSAKAQSAQAAAAKALVDLSSREKAAEAAVAAGKAELPTDAARKSTYDALSSYSDALGALEAENARLELLGQRALAVKAVIDAAAFADEEEQKAFKAIAQGLGWSFDSSQAAAELSIPAGRGEQIAVLARSRILLPKDPKAALAGLSSVSTESLASARRLAELMVMGRRDPVAVYKAALDARGGAEQGLLASAAADLAAVEAVAPEAGARAPIAEESPSPELQAFSASLDAALSEAQAKASALRSSVAASRAELAASSRAASVIEDRRLERAWYAFESSALDLRSELGSYYDGLGQALAATKQYRRVLAIDASNIRAMQSLALAEEKSGDWAAAAALFKAVNAADPYYGNAASLYNGIARRHAPSYDSTTTMLADSNIIDYRSEASASLPLGSLVSIKPIAEARSIRDRGLGFPAYLSAELGLELPFSLGPLLGMGAGGSLNISPSASLIGTSADYPAAGAATISPEQFLGALSLFSAGGLGIDWSGGAWKAQADYSYRPLPGSVNPSTILLFAHRLELSTSAYYPLGGIFRYFAPRLYASGAYVPEDKENLFGTALVELTPAFRISDSPWMNLGIPLILVYEDSLISRITPYYAASGALTAKGGLLWQSTKVQKDGSSIALSLEGLGGLSMSQVLSSEPSKYLYLYAFIRSDWIRKDRTYSLSLEAAATDPFGVTPKYWSFSLMGGISAKEPDLIVP
jgi:Tfp pilus assembly protein PilF